MSLIYMILFTYMIVLGKLPFDFTKIKEENIKKETHINKITQILDDNNFTRKAIPEV